MRWRYSPIRVHSFLSYSVIVVSAGPFPESCFPSTGIRHTAVLFWRDWFRRLEANAVHWDALRYGYPAKYGATRPPPPEEEQTMIPVQVKEEAVADSQVKAEHKRDVTMGAAKREGGSGYSLRTKRHKSDPRVDTIAPVKR